MTKNFLDFLRRVHHSIRWILHQSDQFNVITTQEMLNDISPLPKSVSTERARNTKSGTQVVTGSPFMDEVKAQVQNKKEKENSKSVRARKQVKHTIFPNLRKILRRTLMMLMTPMLLLLLQRSKSKPGEHWVCCQLCNRWCRTLCVGVAPRIKLFNCELCTNQICQLRLCVSSYPHGHDGVFFILLK